MATFTRYENPDAVIRVQGSGQVGFEPRSLKEARGHASWPTWQRAMDKEVRGLTERGTWTVVSRSSVPDGVKIMGSQFVFKDKPLTGAKARLVVRGDQEFPKALPEDTYAPTPSATEVRMMFSLATELNEPVHSCDISQAFTQSDALKPGSTLYIFPPAGLPHPPDMVWKLVKPLYGLSIAPKAWADTLKAFIKGYGFQAVNCSDTFFVYKSPTGESIRLVFHVDDLLFSFSSDDLGLHFKQALLSRFDGTDDGPVKCFVGIDIKRDAWHTHMTQLPLIESLLKDFDLLDCNPVKIPMGPGTLLTAHDPSEKDDPVPVHRYQHLVGTLQYLVTWTRPDLAFATNQLAKFSIAPHKKHMDAALKVLRYLSGTRTLGITYTRNGNDPNRLLAFADADWAACTTTRRSYSGFVCLLNGGAIQWRCRQQKSVATSTSEAEFVSASRGSDEILWLRRILEDAGYKQTTPTPLYDDNRSCRMMSENPVANERSKHIDYRVHALRDRVSAGIVRLVDCPTVDMVADPFTKNLAVPDYERHRAVYMGSAPHTAPRLPADLTKSGPRVFAPRSTLKP
jgi:hypothetical protein